MKKYKLDFSSLALRVALAAIFLVHGFTNIMATIPTPSMHFFASLGLPGMLDYLVLFLEINAGAFLLLGIFTRLIAVLTSVQMTVTSVVALPYDYMVPDSITYWLFPAFIAVSAVSLAVLGGGRFSVFAKIYR